MTNLVLVSEGDFLWPTIQFGAAWEATKAAEPNPTAGVGGGASSQLGGFNFPASQGLPVSTK